MTTFLWASVSLSKQQICTVDSKGLDILEAGEGDSFQGQSDEGTWGLGASVASFVGQLFGGGGP